MKKVWLQLLSLLLPLTLLAGGAGTLKTPGDMDEHDLVDMAKVSLPNLVKEALAKVPGKCTAAGYTNDGTVMAYVNVAAEDGSEKALMLDAATGKVTSVDTKNKAEEAKAAAEEAKSDAEIAAKDPDSEEARKAREAKEDKKPGIGAKSSLVIAKDADDPATAKAAKLSMGKALYIAGRRMKGTKLASAFLTHDDTGHVFYAVNGKHKNGDFTLIYIDPATGKVLGTEVGG
jgi:uncharacterized membrane protein YkoI